MKQIYNPYLPLDEYVPDGEPHLFDGRVYIYGSHDLAGGEAYCLGDYVTWSAPENDLTDWRYEGVIYRKDQDPSNKEMHREIWAPDVAKGTDGKYYLFYCLAFYPEIGVAVSDSPAGPFEFYGHIHYPENIKNGKTLSEHLPFDPAVLVDDDGKVFLYYGFSPAVPLKKEGEDGDIEGAEKLEFSEGAMVAELERPTVELRKNILRNKIHRDGLQFPPEVIDYIAENVGDSVRDLEGIVISIMAHSTIYNKEIDLELTQRIVRKVVKSESKSITVDDIINVVCKHFSLDTATIHTKSRKREVVQARQIAMFLAKSYTDFSTAKIGALIGHKDHATVLHACKTIKELREVDKTFRAEIDDIQASLKKQG